MQLQGTGLALGVDLEDIARRTEGYRWAGEGHVQAIRRLDCGPPLLNRLASA